MKLKFRKKKDLIYIMEYELGIKRTARDIEILEYDKSGYIESFSVKLGSNFIGVSYFGREVGYSLNKNLTFLLNDV